jgi:hypothetical protein
LRQMLRRGSFHAVERLMSQASDDDDVAIVGHGGCAPENRFASTGESVANHSGRGSDLLGGVADEIALTLS